MSRVLLSRGLSCPPSWTLDVHVRKGMFCGHTTSMLVARLAVPMGPSGLLLRHDGSAFRARRASPQLWPAEVRDCKVIIGG
jgi:hypothetical protein